MARIAALLFCLFVVLCGSSLPEKNDKQQHRSSLCGLFLDELVQETLVLAEREMGQRVLNFVNRVADPNLVKPVDPCLFL